MEMTLRPYQQAAVDAVYEHLQNKDTNPCVVLPTGCHAKDHPILMYDGTIKKVQDVAVGDLLMGADSTPRRVLALARGHETMMRITPRYGESFVVNANHIIRLCNIGNGSHRNAVVRELLFDTSRFHWQLCLRHGIAAGHPVQERNCDFELEQLPDDDFYGFSLDGNHLYVDGNFIVHHNTGKSVVIGKIATDVAEQWGGRVLVLAHVKELLEQNADKIRTLCPDLKVGIYSAGLKSRDTKENVIVAGIQSVYNKACELDAFDIIIVDEVHSIAPDGDGIYRTFLNDMKVINPKLRVVGLTATPYRLKGGLICQPGNIMNEICYEAGLKEMIAQGYLSPIVARAGKVEADLSSLHIRGGEFITDEVESTMNRDEVVDAACREIVELSKERNSVLIFTTSVKHCEHVAKRIRECSGQECAIVTGETPAAERAEILARFRGEQVPSDLFGKMKPPLKYVANVSVLTTGVDVPNIDCIAMLRPTASPGLLMQIAGRGLRLHPSKSNCLFLDYGGNILRHGPLDMITVKDKTPGNGDAPAKKCPQCLALIHAAYAKCPECGYAFPPPEKSNITQHASRAGVLSGEVWYGDCKVHQTYYSVHEKRFAEPGTPKTMRVDYQIVSAEDAIVSQWVCPEHTGYAREKFIKWWTQRCAGGCPVPGTAAEAVRLAEAGALAEPVTVTLKTVTGERYPTVHKVKPGDRPPMTEALKLAITTGAAPIDDDDLPF